MVGNNFLLHEVYSLTYNTSHFQMFSSQNMDKQLNVHDISKYFYYF